MSRSRHGSRCGRNCGVCWNGATNQARLHRLDRDAIERREAADEARRPRQERAGG